MAEPEDPFFALGFTGEDIRDGALFRTMQLATENLKMMQALHGRFGALAHAAERGLVVKRDIEIYFSDAYGFVQAENFAKQYGNQYQVIYFYNEAALDLSNQFKLQLPK